MLAAMDDRGKTLVAEPVLRHGPFLGRVSRVAVAFEATCDGVKTIDHGRLELRS